MKGTSKAKGKIERSVNNLNLLIAARSATGSETVSAPIIPFGTPTIAGKGLPHVGQKLSESDTFRPQLEHGFNVHSMSCTR